MAVNNPSGDYFNPPSNMSQDFEEYRFEDLEVDELFWRTNKPKDASGATPFRKVNQTEGRNLKTQMIHTFDRKTKVFQKI